MNKISAYISRTLITVSVVVLGALLLPTYLPLDEEALGATKSHDDVVIYLANERNISLEEAQKRISWQEKAGELDDKLQELLPRSDYGGTWINGSNDRVSIGTTEATSTAGASRQIILKELQVAGLSDAADIVPVKYSYDTLTQTTQAIHNLHQQYVKRDQWPIQMGPKVDLNRVQVDIPDESHLAPEHQKVLSAIEEKYKDQVFFDTYDELPREEAACNWWFCDSPLRGAVGIKGSAGGYSGINCTAGPIVQGNVSGNLYVLTAGHCAPGGNRWSSETYGYTDRFIGSIHHSLYSGATPIDAMIISTSNTDFSSVTGKILKRSGEGWSSLSGYNDIPPTYDEAYDIQAHASSIVGERVCISPAITGGWGSEPNGGSCGEVEQTQIMWTAGDATTLVHKPGYCTRPGDSGAPIFASGNVVKGVHRGSGGSTVCQHYKYYTPMSTLLNGFSQDNKAIHVH